MKQLKLNSYIGAKVIFLVLILIMVSCRNKQPQMEYNTPEITNNEEQSTPRASSEIIDATQDAEYMVDTYANVLYSIKAAEVVKQKSDKKEVVAVARQIEKANREVFKDLGQLAEAKKISLPSKLSMAQLTELNKLEKNSRNLEEIFLEQMEDEHREGMALLEKISKESEDNEISTVAISCLSTVKSQYDEVVELKERMSL